MSSDREGGGRAFPLSVTMSSAGDYVHGFDGMSLRDYFAAKAIVIVARQADLDNAGTPELAAACYEFADQLLEERESPLLERTSQQLRADLAENRASRYEVLLRTVVDQCNKADIEEHGELRAALAAATLQLEEDEVPF